MPCPIRSLPARPRPAPGLLARPLLALVLLLWACGLPLACRAADAVLGDEARIVFAGSGLGVLCDATRALTLEAVRSEAQASRFEPLRGHLGRGYTPDACWLRFAFVNEGSQTTQRWLEVSPPFLDDIRLFHLRPDGSVDSRRGGDRLPQSAKEEDYRGHVFKLDLQPGRHEVYLRLQTTSAMVAIVTLWQPADFASDQRQSYLAYGLYFSLILTVMLFNAANWLVWRRPIFLVYVVYLLLNAVQWMAVNGFVSEFVFPESPALADMSLGVALSLSGGMALLFYTLLMDMRRHHPFIYRASLAGVVLCLITAAATPLGYYRTFAPALLSFGVFSAGTAPWPTRRLWRTGDLWNRALAAAYAAYGSLLCVNILSALGVVPYGPWNDLAGKASNVCHILLLHFGILLQYRRLESEHAAALEKSAIAEEQARLEKAHREDQDRLLAMITHEIRTPVAVIDASVQSLKALDATADAEHAERAQRYERIGRAVHRLDALMDLAVAQTQRQVAQWQLATTAIEPAALTQQTLQMLGSPHAERVQLTTDPSLPVIHGDSRMLRFALLNLLDNACKYSPGDAPVRLELRPSARGVCWRVQDEGPGIDPSMQDKIFDKYVRAGESGERGTKAGLGLGLYLARHIVERHGGTLVLAAPTMPRRGACFEMTVPATPAEGSTT